MSSMYEALSPSLSFVMPLEGLLFVWNCLHIKMTSQPSSPPNLFTVADKLIPGNFFVFRYQPPLGNQGSFANVTA
jgi:hypothetical protein